MDQEQNFRKRAHRTNNFHHMDYPFKGYEGQGPYASYPNTMSDSSSVPDYQPHMQNHPYSQQANYSAQYPDNYADRPNFPQFYEAQNMSYNEGRTSQPMYPPRHTQHRNRHLHVSAQIPTANEPEYRQSQTDIQSSDVQSESLKKF